MRFRAGIFLTSVLVLMVCLPVRPARGEVLIAEFMALNDQTLDDNDGEASDWLELLNTGAEAVDLGGWSLTDKASAPRAWIFPPTVLQPGKRLLVYASGKNRRDAGAPLHTNFKLSGDGEFLGLFKPDGSTAHAYAPAFPPQITDVSYGLAQETVETEISAPDAVARYFLPADNSLETAWTAPDFNDSTWAQAPQGLGFETLAGGFAPYISEAGNLLGVMYGKRSSAFVRIPFNISDPAAVSGLKLKMRYDDGFAAWVNGVGVAENLAPDTDPLPWNAAATGERANTTAATWEEFPISGNDLQLRQGTNVLAIQWMNRAAGNADALLQTSITAIQQRMDPAAAPVYFPLPTPGEANNAGTANPGPVVRVAVESVPQPAPGVPLSIPVTAVAAPTFHPIASVTLNYRTMFNAETVVPMHDDGKDGDLVASDGIWTGVMTPTLQAGQMLRWRVVATDSQGGASTSPPYPDPLDSPKYWGAVATDPSLAESRLPIFQWFVPPGVNPDTEAGGRISVFYLGEFYDNIEARLRGRSTRSFPKKGHNLDFNHNARFRWNADERRVKDIDLITNWADKSKTRLSTAYEICRISGIPAHFASPVRVQRNAAFHGVFDMVEDGDDRYLERAGLDPEGALYKFKEYNHLRAPVAGYVKKTRTDEPDKDLQDLVAAIAESKPLATRRQYGYDFLDLPAIINYHAVCAIIGHRDQGGKNFYVYRDTNGSQRWQFLPWDLDLTLGHTFTYSGTTSWGVAYSGQGYFDDDIDSQAILRIGWDNPIKKLIWNVPELNEMFVRRVRTLADQFIGTEAAPSPYFPERIASLLDQLDPPGLTGLTDAELDLRKWGFWVDGSSSSTVIPWTDTRVARHRLRAQATRMLTANDLSLYPGVAEYRPFFPVDGVPLPVRNLDSRPAWLPGRRQFLYTPGAALSGSLGLPEAQSPTAASLEISGSDINPASGGQDAEYIAIRNTGTQSLDLSGWTLSGAVDYTFSGGCVLPAPSAADPAVGTLYIAKNAAGFRNRTVSPKGGESRLMVDGYSGQFSTRGETLEIRRPDKSLALTWQSPAAPSALQQFLRISGFLYAPLPVSPQEMELVPQAANDDFEWIELVNTGTATLDLSGARFTEGIDFTFPPGVKLDAGRRLVIVGNAAAFEARYGPVPRVGGVFAGNLNNSGERIQLVDAAGESVLDFEYKGGWSAAADKLGHALTVPEPGAKSFTDWDLGTTWAPSLKPGGIPGEAEVPEGVAVSFSTWQARSFDATALADVKISGPAADPDHDGLANLLEYASGRNPLKPDAAILTNATLTEGRLRFDCARDRLAVDAVLTFVASSGGTTPAETTTPASFEILPDGTWRVSFPLSGPRRFFQLKAELP